MKNIDIKSIRASRQKKREERMARIKAEAELPPPKSLKERLERVRPSRWIRFGVVSVLFFLLVIWIGNPWVGLLWFLLLDLYITNYIPWTWWKKSENRVTRTLMSWVDAIVYALTLVYIIFIFVGQQYNIPSSSLEKSLLVGDYLWVNKFVYGPRIPQTPLHFPLAQHTLPLVGTKSYIENPQLKYHRLPGLRSVERGDIVVFNYPQGDTVTLKVQNPDYYQTLYSLEQENLRNPGSYPDARAYIRQHPEIFGDVVWRPVDRRENYVKRAIGLPGERLKIVNDTIYINGRAIGFPEHVQFNYIIPVKNAIEPERWTALGVRAEDYGSGPMQIEGIEYPFYDVPLTSEMLAQVKKWSEVSGEILPENEFGIMDQGVFPMQVNWPWTRSNMGEIWIPQRGSTLHLNLSNLPMYERAIRVYEGNELEVKDGKIYINGKPTEYYTFKMDYYWMMGDNRDRSADSRYWGFVPEDHIVGTPAIVVMSIDGEKGDLRWDRFLRTPNPGADKERVK